MGNEVALSSLGLLPRVGYFMWLLASQISNIGLYTLQTQTIQQKAQDLPTVYF